MAEEPEIFPQSEDDDVIADFDPDDSVGLLDTEFTEPLPYGFTWAYDFNKNDLDFSKGNPTKLSGLNTVNEWITHTLNVEKFEVPIYENAIGTDIFKLVGDTIDTYVMSRVTSEVRDAIEAHDRITEVNYISALSIKGDIYVYFTYLTDRDVEGQAFVQLG